MSLCIQQTNLPALLLAHLPAGDSELFSHDVRHQPCVLLRQYCPPVAAAAFPPLQIAHQQLGLHQSGSYFPSGNMRTNMRKKKEKKSGMQFVKQSFFLV